jgi:hypothetical protein
VTRPGTRNIERFGRLPGTWLEEYPMLKPAHSLPPHLPQRLDLRSPPADSRNARNYRELVLLLEELGSALDERSIGTDELRQWERRVLDLIEDGEIDMLFQATSPDAYDPEKRPEERWANLRRILLRRKRLLT